MMQPKKRIQVGLVCLGVMGLLGCVFLFWKKGRETKPPRPQIKAQGDHNPNSAFAITERSTRDPIAPEKATKADWDRVQFLRGSIQAKDGSVSFNTAVHVWPVLEAIKILQPSDMYCSVKRDADGKLETTVFSSGIANCLVFDWTSQRITKATPLKRGEGCVFDEYHKEQDDSATISPGLGTAKGKDTGGSEMLAVTFNELSGKGRIKRFYIPFNLDRGIPCMPFTRSRYPIALFSRIGKEGFISFVLVDLCRIKLIGEIPFEPAMMKTSPYYAIDLEKDVITATGGTLNWVMTMDFSSYVKKLIADGTWKRGDSVFKFD